MFRAFALACCLAGGLAFRSQQRRVRGWKTRTDSKIGACAGHVAKQDLPIYFPLHCSGRVTNLKLRAEARGHTSPRLRLSIDGIDKGYRTFPILPATRVWEVSHGSLSAGVHLLRYSGDRLSFRWLEVTGEGAGCSLENAPGYKPSAFTNTGLDVITRVVGPSGNNFSDLSKRQLYFAHQVIGTNADDSISSTAISDGMYEWMYMYSKEQSAKDSWLSRWENGGMYEESNITPHLQVSLDQLPGRFGDDMVVCEPCNSVSNIMFHEAAAWSACQGYPFTSDELATLLASFSMTGAGSMFFHVSATSAGHLSDVFPMDLFQYTVHQIIVKAAINQAGSALTQADKDNMMYLGKGYGLATAKAKEVTALFRRPYDRDVIFNTLSERPPNYVMCIVTIVLTVIESMYGRWPIPGVGSLLNMILDSVLGLLSGSDIEWIEQSYRPAIKKTFESVSYCGDRTKLVGGMLSFAVTFIEAFVFQEELIPVPSWVREVVKFLELLGITAEQTFVMKNTWDIYNGQRSYCYNRSPHGTWHEKAAQGLLHMSDVAALMVTGVKPGKC